MEVRSRSFEDALCQLYIDAFWNLVVYINIYHYGKNDLIQDHQNNWFWSCVKWSFPAKKF